MFLGEGHRRLTESTPLSMNGLRRVSFPYIAAFRSLQSARISSEKWMFFNNFISLSCVMFHSVTIKGVGRFCFCFQRRQRPMIRINLSQDEYLCNKLQAAGVADRQIAPFCSGNSICYVILQCWKHAGPCCQMVGRRNYSGIWPRDIRSKGLSLVETWRQSRILVFVWISETVNDKCFENVR